jgi:hypothetical protein
MQAAALTYIVRKIGNFHSLYTLERQATTRSYSLVRSVFQVKILVLASMPTHIQVCQCDVQG